MDADHQRFIDAAERYYASPIELRNLLLAAVAVSGSEQALPRATAEQLKHITGVRHGTFGAAANKVMETPFRGSGNYWRSFLMDGLSPWRNIKWKIKDWFSRRL